MDKLAAFYRTFLGAGALYGAAIMAVRAQTALDGMYLMDGSGAEAAIFKITGNGSVSKGPIFVGDGVDDLVLDSRGNLDVPTEERNYGAQGGILQFAPDGTRRTVDTTGIDAVAGKPWSPLAVAIDAHDHLFVNAMGQIVHQLGNGTWRLVTPGPQAAGPSMAVDANGDLVELGHLAEPVDSNPIIRKITISPTTGLATGTRVIANLSVVADPSTVPRLGQVVAGHLTPPRALRNRPEIIVIGPDGNYYVTAQEVAEWGSGDESVLGSGIFKVAPDGAVSKFAEGPRYLAGMAFDAAGDLFVAGSEKKWGDNYLVYYVSKTGEFFEFSKADYKVPYVPDISIVIGPKFKLDQQALGPKYAPAWYARTNLMGRTVGYAVVGVAAAMTMLFWLWWRRRERRTA